METVRAQYRKTLNFTTIYKKIMERGKTISELAVEYGMAEDKFIEELKQGLGIKLFPGVKKASDKNEKIVEELKRSASKRRKSLAKKSKSNNSSYSTDLSNKNVSKIKSLLRKKESLQKELSDCEKTHCVVERNLEDATNEKCDAEANLNAAQERFDAAQKTFDKRQKKFNQSQKAKESLQTEISSIDNEISDLASKVIYLISPHYKGTIPEYGRLISCETLQGVVAEIKKGDILINEGTVENMAECGFVNLEEYNCALEFAKLCIEFVLQTDEYIILVDDPKIQKVLETQGIFEL